MMRIILLLLVTLMGPFCTFTQASTLVAPTTVVSTLGANTVSDASADTTIETVHQDAVSTSQPASGATEVSALTEVPMVSTGATVTESEDKLKTASPTDTIQATEAGPEETTDAKATTVVEESRVEGTAVTENAESEHADKDEAMGTGQVVGIVIGALIAVIVVIAVIILVVRRMGQYSTAKKRKPQKQESILISPLKRKARQEEKKKKSGKF